MTETSLSLQTASIQPKPTKTEIIEAMVCRSEVLNREENKRREALRSDLEAKVIELAKQEFTKKNASLKPTFEVNDWKQTVVVRYVVKNPAIKKLIEEIDKNGKVYWNESSVRKSIREKLSGVKKNRLLDDPQTVNAIDTLLASWSK